MSRISQNQDNIGFLLDPAGIRGQIEQTSGDAVSMPRDSVRNTWALVRVFARIFATEGEVKAGQDSI